MSRIVEYMEQRLKRGMNIPKSVIFKVDTRPDYMHNFQLIRLSAQMAIDGGMMIGHGVRNSTRITKIETAEAFLKVAVPALQEWLRKKSGEDAGANYDIDWNQQWYKEPAPTARKI